MRPYLLTIFLSAALLASGADRYEIEYINGAYITYRGQQLVVGDTFEHKDSLQWQTATVIHVRNTRTGNRERLRKEDFDVHKDFSLWSYLLKINHGSSRTCEDYCMCSILDNVFYLQDTIRVRTDDPDIIDVYTGHLPQSALPQYFLTYSYNGDTYTVSPPLDVDELIITKQLFTYIPPRQRIQVYVFSIDRHGRKQTVADSMIIEFR
ncbi:MAG: hypothetical protein IKQ50_07415 [Paludibacteraceae bacterium]|nr:hypothetical protein [Paludibacteraceae bacterium]